MRASEPETFDTTKSYEMTTNNALRTLSPHPILSIVSRYDGVECLIELVGDARFVQVSMQLSNTRRSLKEHHTVLPIAPLAQDLIQVLKQALIQSKSCPQQKQSERNKAFDHRKKKWTTHVTTQVQTSFGPFRNHRVFVYVGGEALPGTFQNVVFLNEDLKFDGLRFEISIDGGGDGGSGGGGGSSSSSRGNSASMECRPNQVVFV